MSIEEEFGISMFGIVGRKFKSSNGMIHFLLLGKHIVTKTSMAHIITNLCHLRIKRRKLSPLEKANSVLIGCIHRKCHTHKSTMYAPISLFVLLRPKSNIEHTFEIVSSTLPFCCFYWSKKQYICCIFRRDFTAAFATLFLIKMRRCQ